MARWLRRAYQGHELCCLTFGRHVCEPSLVELGVYCPSVGLDPKF